jgi:hypothetical protein
MRLMLVLFILGVAHGAHAQEAAAREPAPAPSAESPPLVQAPGAPEAPRPASAAAAPRVLLRGRDVQIQTGRGQRHSGALVSLEPGALSLQVEPERVVTLLLEDVRQLSVKRRSVVEGTLLGTGAGGLTGGLFVLYLCTHVIDGKSSLPLCAGGGALIGGAIGAGVGAVLGLAVPRWSTVYERDGQHPLSLQLEEPEARSALARWLFHPGPVGELGVQLGYARDMGSGNPTDGFGGRLHVLARLGPYLALGPEVAWYGGVGTEDFVDATGQVFRTHRNLFQLGGLVRAGLEVGPTRTSALVGLAFYENRQGYAGLSLGGEVEVRPWERPPPVVFDVRYHLNIDELQDDPDRLTFGLGTRLQW